MSNKLCGFFEEDIKFLLDRAKVKHLIQVYSFRVNGGKDFIDFEENKKILKCLKRLSDYKPVLVRLSSESVSLRFVEEWCEKNYGWKFYKGSKKAPIRMIDIDKLLEAAKKQAEDEK